MNDHPLLKTANLIYYLSVWIIIGLLHYFFLTQVTGLDSNYAITDSIVFNLIFFFMGISFWYSAKYISFDNNSLIMVFFKNDVASVLISLVWIGIAYFILIYFVGVDEDIKEFLYGSIYWRLLAGVLYYDIIISLFYIYIFYGNFKEKVKQESELKALVKDAEIRTLKYQLNPHFIFNSLNSISSLTIIDPNRARDMVIKLSSFLRATLVDDNQQRNKLCDELKNARLYVEIEKIRFEDKFEYVEEISEECASVLVPNMIIQPLLENAIKYGVYESLDKVFIKVKCIQENGYMKIIVENNYDEDSPKREGKKIGLRNIKSRLNLIYNQDNLLLVEKEKNLFRVKIFIPLDEEKHGKN